MREPGPAATVQLGPARPCEARAIAALSRDLVEQGLVWRYDPARIERYLRRKDAVVLAARAGGRVVGFAIMEYGEERAHLVLLAVDPAYRRRGIGRRLLEWLIESARTAGIESVHLELRAANAPARRFYRALGFSETLLVPRYYAGRESALRMVRLLRRPGTPLPDWRPPERWRTG